MTPTEISQHDTIALTDPNPFIPASVTVTSPRLSEEFKVPEIISDLITHHDHPGHNRVFRGNVREPDGLKTNVFVKVLAPDAHRGLVQRMLLESRAHFDLNVIAPQYVADMIDHIDGGDDRSVRGIVTLAYPSDMADVEFTRLSDLRHIEGLLECLAAVHSVGIIHRDVKPGNLVIDTAQRVRLLDFGIIKVNEHGSPRLRKLMPEESQGDIIGTAAYMSPEALNYEKHLLADGRTDVYGVGVVMYEKLTGTVPCDTCMADFKKAGRHTHTPPDPTLLKDLPLEIQQFTLKLLAADPNKRPFADQALAELRHIIRKLGIKA